MATEIERKFLVSGEDWRDPSKGKAYRQGYIETANGTTVRVRIEGSIGKLTIKGPSKGMSRAEYDYEIPLDDASELLDTLCARPLIEKTRYKIEHQGFTWEVDDFDGDNQGLIVAEVEMESEETEVPLPDWIGEEVTGDDRYFNAALVKKPFKDW